MKINRALGLLLFLFVIQLILTNVIPAFSSAAVAVFNTIEAAAIHTEREIQHIR